MASNVLKVQKVSEPVVRSVELRDMYDHSLNDLEETWNDLGKLKSTLRSIGHRVDDAVERVPAASATESHVMPRKAKQMGEPLESLPHYRPRKVCRLDERYDVSSPTGEALCAPAATSRHVAFKMSEVRGGSDRELWPHDVLLDQDSKSSLTINLTDSRAERETQVRFLNDSLSPTSRAAASRPGGQAEPDMAPWVRRVNVRVPKAPAPGDATKEDASARAIFGIRQNWHTVKEAVQGDMSKLQETIRKQRAMGSCSASNGSDEAKYATAAVNDGHRYSNGLSHNGPSASDEVMARKVASLPAAKAYPGFSRPSEAVAASTRPAAAKAVRLKPSEVPAAKHKPGTPSSPRLVTGCDPAAGGIQAISGSAAATKHSKITPSSWRAGLRLVRQELGPVAPLVVSTAAPAAQRASDGNCIKASSPRPLSAPAAMHKKESQSRSPAAVTNVAAPRTASSRRQASDTGLGKRPSASTTTAVTRVGSPEATAGAVGRPGELATAESAHKATLSGLVESISSGSVTLPDAAKDVLRELQSDAGRDEHAGEEINDVPRKIGWDSADRRSIDRAPTGKQRQAAVTARSRAGQPLTKDHGQTAQRSARAAVSTPPPQKTRRYDAADIQRYMQKKKSEERRQRAAEAAAKRKTEEEHQRKLQELFMKQKGVHRLGSTLGRPHATGAHDGARSAADLGRSAGGPALTTHNDTFTHDPQSGSLGRIAVVDSDKENRGTGSGTPTSGSAPPSSRTTPEHGAAAGRERASSPARCAQSHERAVTNAADNDCGDNADGLLSFADENLKRILNKYKTRRELDVHVSVPEAGAVLPAPLLQWQQQQQQWHPGTRTAEPADRLQPRPAAVRSHVDRIASIKAATSVLAAKIHAAQARLTDQCLSGQHESWRSLGSKSVGGPPLPEQLPVRGQRAGRAGHRATAAAADGAGSPPPFARTMPGASGWPSQKYGAQSWPYGGNGGHRESESEPETSTAWKTESVTSSSGDDRSQVSLDSSGLDHHHDLDASREMPGSRADLSRTGASSAGSAVSVRADQAGGGVADRIASTLGQTAFCMASRHRAEEGPTSTWLPAQSGLPNPTSVLPQHAGLGATAVRSTAGVQRDVALNDSPPKPYADYYSSINVHLRKSSTEDRDGAKPAVPKTSSGIQKASAVREALPMKADAVEAASAPSLLVREESASGPTWNSTAPPLESSWNPELRNPSAQIADTTADGGVGGRGSPAFRADVRHGMLYAITTSGRGLPSGITDDRTRRDREAVVGVDSSASTASSSSNSQISEPSLGREQSPTLPHSLSASGTAAGRLRAARGADTVGGSGGVPLPASTHLRLLAGSTTLCSSPLGLGFRMAAELNLLDSVEESVRALTDVEVTRHAAAAQQEATRLALLLEGTKHSHEHELRQLRARVRAEEEEAQRQLEAVRRQALAAAHERDAAVEERRRADTQSQDLYNSTRQLVESQLIATRASAEATRHLAEAAATAGRDEHMRRQEAAQIAAEAASLSAAAAVTATLDRQRLEQAEFFRLARQHVYDRSVQVSAPPTAGADEGDGRYATSFDSATPSSNEPSVTHIRDEGSTVKHAKPSTALQSRPRSPRDSSGSSPSSGTSHASLADSHSTATIVESDDVHTENISTASAISSESDVVVAAMDRLQRPLEQSFSEEAPLKPVVASRRHHSTDTAASDNSIRTASSLAEELADGRGGTALKPEHSGSTIVTDSSLGAGARLSLHKHSDLSPGSSAVKSLSDVQAIVQRQTANDAAKKNASSSTTSASILTTEAVRLHDRQTASDHRSFQREVRPRPGGDHSSASDGSTIRSESGAYTPRKTATREVGDEDDYTQDFYETSNASADESGADVPSRNGKHKVPAGHPIGPNESDKQRSPRTQKLVAQGDVMPPSTSADDTGKGRANRISAGHGGATHGGSNSSASHALSVIRHLIRDERLRALHEEQLARARYRAISYKSKFELQTITTQKEIAGLKGNATLLAELEARAAALADSFARKKAAIQNKLRSDRAYYNSRLENLRERYAELAAAAKDLGAGSVRAAELDTPLEDVDLSLSESSVSSSAGELNADSLVTALGKERQESGRSTSNAIGILGVPPSNVGKLKRIHRDKDWQDEPSVVDTRRQGSAYVQVLGEASRRDDGIATRETIGGGTIAAPLAVDTAEGWSSASQMGSSTQATGAGAISIKTVPDGASAARAAPQSTRHGLLEQQPGVSAARSKPSARRVLHGDSESDESISMSVLEGGTGSESDTEGRIHALQYQLKQKQKEETRLKRLLTDAERERRRERKRNQETSLLKQLELTEENIARLSENLREVQRSAQQSAHVEDGADNVAGQQQQPRPGVSGGIVLTAAHDAAAQVTASITKPLIKQPRAALQQPPASAVSPVSGPAAAAAATASALGAVEAIRPLPGLSLSTQVITDDWTHNLRNADDEARPSVLLSPQVQPEAAIAEYVAVTGGTGNISPAERAGRVDDVRSTTFDLSGHDRGDSQALKGYTSDSFVDSYTSEETGENDSKSESVPEEIPEVLDRDSSEQSAAHLEIEVHRDAILQADTSAPGQKRQSQPELPLVSTSADLGTDFPLPREAGAELLLADTADSLGDYSYESVSAGHQVLSESGTVAEHDGGLAVQLQATYSLSGRGPQLGPAVSQPLDTRLPAEQHDVAVGFDAPSLPDRRQQQPTKVDRSISSESSIAEDFPSSFSADSEIGRNHEANATPDVLRDMGPVNSMISMRGDTVEHRAALHMPPATAELPLSPATSDTGDDALLAAGPVLSPKRDHDDVHRPVLDEELAADEYETEEFDSDPSSTSVATHSVPVDSPHDVNAGGAMGSRSLLEAQVLLGESKPRSSISSLELGMPADTEEAAHIRVENGSTQHVMDKDLPRDTVTNESDGGEDASDKDVLWSASDDSRLQSRAVGDGGELGKHGGDAKDDAEVTARMLTAGRGDPAELSHESSISESLEEVAELAPSDGAEIGSKSLSSPPFIGSEPVSVLRQAGPSAAQMTATVDRQHEHAEVMPSEVSSLELRAAAAPDGSDRNATVVDKLADWLLTEALEAYAHTRDAKLKAAGTPSTSASASEAKMPDGQIQAPSNTKVASSVLIAPVGPEATRPVPEPVAALQATSVPRGSAEVVPQSASALSLADLPPLVAKKAPTAPQQAATALAVTAPAATSVVALAAGQLRAAPEAAGSAGEAAKSARPLSPVLGSSGAAGPSSDPDDAWSKLDKEINSVFGDDVDWFDEDFGLGVSKKPDAPSLSGKKPVASQQQAPPPPYPGSPEVVRQAGKMDAKGAPQPAPFSVIPDKQEDILSLAFSAVDTFWQMRRFGESWDGAQPPEEFLTGATGTAGGLEATSKASHCRMVFDLVGEMLREIYREETDMEVQDSWSTSRRLKLPSRRYWKGKSPPATVDELKKVVEQHIFKIIGCQPQMKSTAVGPRARKKDRVDGILIDELRQEEADWVDYTEDEDAVKEAVFKDIFNHLMVDTGKHISEGIRITKRYNE